MRGLGEQGSQPLVACAGVSVAVLVVVVIDSQSLVVSHDVGCPILSELLGPTGHRLGRLVVLRPQTKVVLVSQSGPDLRLPGYELLILTQGQLDGLPGRLRLHQSLDEVVRHISTTTRSVY